VVEVFEVLDEMTQAEGPFERAIFVGFSRRGQMCLGKNEPTLIHSNMYSQTSKVTRRTRSGLEMKENSFSPGNHDLCGANLNYISIHAIKSYDPSFPDNSQPQADVILAHRPRNTRHQNDRTE
jgi:hypothetical protein